MRYSQLTHPQRCLIEALYATGATQVEITKRTGVSQSTISHELARNRIKTGCRLYCADKRRKRYGGPEDAGPQFVVSHQVVPVGQEVVSCADVGYDLKVQNIGHHVQAPIALAGTGSPEKALVKIVVSQIIGIEMRR